MDGKIITAFGGYDSRNRTAVKTSILTGFTAINEDKKRLSYD